MNGVNKVILIGRLGADPETRYTQAGGCVCSLRMATSERWTDKETGEKQERTEWHSVTIFGRTAEVAAEYLKKGSAAYIEGRLRTDKYTDKEGVERYSTKIVCDSLQLLGSPGESGEKAARPPARSAPPAGKHAEARRPPPDPDPQNGTDLEDDIPF